MLGKGVRDYEPLPGGFQSPGDVLEKRRRDDFYADPFVDATIVGDMSKFQPGEAHTAKLISAINEVRTAIVDKDAVILETAEAD